MINSFTMSKQNEYERFQKSSLSIDKTLWFEIYNNKAEHIHTSHGYNNVLYHVNKEIQFRGKYYNTREVIVINKDNITTQYIYLETKEVILTEIDFSKQNIENAFNYAMKEMK